MSEMAERLEAAFAKAIADGVDNPAYFARLALTTMREPTEAMSAAGSVEAHRPAGWHAVYRNIYRAMIDAAAVK